MHTTTTPATTTPTVPATEAPTRWLSPPVDVFSSDTAWRIVADVPGASRERLAITLEGTRLRVEARRGDGTGWRRVFSVPRTADPDGIEAHLANGVLTLDLPLAESARPRTIPVRG